MDIGNHAYAWRIMGVIAGALLLGCLYLLVRMLFRRRAVALLTAGLVLVDGMFFAQSRIAMNDTYVALFIVAAYMLFVPIYLGLWRRRWIVALAIPAIGVLLGLALASKWVGAYAIGGIVLLVLLRSALGRLLALAAMVGLTGVLGWLAIGATSATAPIGDATFLVLMVILTGVLAAALVVRPIRWTLDEVRFAVGAPALAGGLALLAGIVLGGRAPASTGSSSSGNLVLVGAVFLVLAAATYVAFSLAGRRRRGAAGARPRRTAPTTPIPPADPPDQGWLVPGALLGAPWLLALACFTVVPLVVYVISYAPWVALNNQWFTGNPAGHTGQTLLDLQIQMYNYHNDLRASHPASSPWWAWPFDFKPVWFFQQGYANDTTGITYDAGNLVIFWLGVPVMAWAAWQAWARRSLALTHPGHRLRLPVALLVAHRPGQLPVPLLHGAALPVRRRGLLAGRAVARSLARAPGSWPASPLPAHSWGRRSCGCCACRCACSPGPPGWPPIRRCAASSACRSCSRSGSPPPPWSSSSAASSCSGSCAWCWPNGPSRPAANGPAAPACSTRARRGW